MLENVVFQDLAAPGKQPLVALHGLSSGFAVTLREELLELNAQGHLETLFFLSEQAREQVLGGHVARLPKPKSKGVL